MNITRKPWRGNQDRESINICLDGNRESDWLFGVRFYMLYTWTYSKLMLCFVFYQLTKPFSFSFPAYILHHIHFITIFLKILAYFRWKKHQFNFFFFFIFWTKLSSRYNVRGKHSSQCIIVNSASITWNNTQLNSHFNSIAFIPTGFKFHFLGRPSFFSKSGILLSI